MYGFTIYNKNKINNNNWKYW